MFWDNFAESRAGGEFLAADEIQFHFAKGVADFGDGADRLPSLVKAVVDGDGIKNIAEHSR